METAPTLANYYALRAPEYERIYGKPERQGDLRELHALVRERFAGLEVLEVACGTGYWTETLAKAARSVTAVDINEEVLEIARSKPGNAAVRFQIADVYDLPESGLYSGALVVFWWSHMPKSRIAGFLRGLTARLLPGAKMMFIDNRFVPRSSTPITRADGEGNTYQTRRLEDRSLHEVLKNFPDEEELKYAIAPHAVEVGLLSLEYYWVLSCRMPGG